MVVQIPERTEIIDIKDTVRLRESLNQVMTGHPVLPVPLNPREKYNIRSHLHFAIGVLSRESPYLGVATSQFKELFFRIQQF